MAYQSNTWHTDLTYSAEPPMASILHGDPGSGSRRRHDVEQPVRGLRRAIVRRCATFVDGLSAVHNIVVEHAGGFHGTGSWAPKQLVPTATEITPPVDSPGRSHAPRNGSQMPVRESQLHFAHQVGRDIAPKATHCSRCYTRISNNPNTPCASSGSKNSLAMWDNRCTQHYALVDYRSKRIDASRDGQRRAYALAGDRFDRILDATRERLVHPLFPANGNLSRRYAPSAVGSTRFDRRDGRIRRRRLENRARVARRRASVVS